MRPDKTAIVHFVSQIGRTLAGFVTTLFIARTLGSGVLGTYVLVIAVLAWLQIPTNAVGRSVSKRMSEGEHKGRFIVAGIAVTLILVSVIATIMYLFRGAFDAYIGSSVNTLMIGLFASQAFFTVTLAGLDGQKRVEMSGLLRMVEQILRSGLQIGLIVLGHGLAGILLGHALAVSIIAIAAVPFYGIGFSFPQMKQFKRLFDFAKYSWLEDTSARSLDWIDTLVLGFFVPPSLIGIYEVAWTIASTLSLATISIANTVFPEISDLETRDVHDRIQSLLSDSIVFSGLFVIPGLFGAAVIGDRVLAIYGPEFTAGVGVLVLLVLVRVFTSYGLLFHRTISGIDRPDITMRIDGAFLGVNLVLNIVLVSAIGWHGAALATGISAGMTLLLGYKYVGELIGRPSVPWSTLSKQVASSVIMATVILALKGVVPPNHYLTVGLVLVGGGLYLGILLTISGRIRTRLQFAVQ